MCPCQANIPFSLYTKVYALQFDINFEKPGLQHIFEEIKTHILQRCWPAAGNVLPCGSDFRCMGKFQMLFELYNYVVFLTCGHVMQTFHFLCIWKLCPAVWHKIWKARFATHFWRKIKTHILQRCWPAAGDVLPCCLVGCFSNCVIFRTILLKKQLVIFPSPQVHTLALT